MRFECPRCGGRLEAESGMAGEVLDCAHCNEAIEVPQLSVVRSVGTNCGRRERREFLVEVIQEGWVGTLLLGASKLPQRRISEFLNTRGLQGWALDFMVVERRRLFLFWTREAVILTMSRALA